MGYHAKYFQAQSYWQLGLNQHKKVEETAKGMGLAIGYMNQSLTHFEEAKAFANILGGPYKQNFESKYGEARAFCDKCNNENKTIYYD